MSSIRPVGRGNLCWVSSIFGLGLASEVVGCVADEFPVRDGLKVGSHLSFMPNLWLNLKKVDTTRRGSVSLMAHLRAGGHSMRSVHNIRASPWERLPY